MEAAHCLAAANELRLQRRGYDLLLRARKLPRRRHTTLRGSRPLRSVPDRSRLPMAPRCNLNRYLIGQSTAIAIWRQHNSGVRCDLQHWKQNSGGGGRRTAHLHLVAAQLVNRRMQR